MRVIHMPKGQLESYRDRLQWRLIASQGSYFFADKLQSYQRSHVSVISGIASIVYLTSVTIFAFAFVYMAIHKMDHSALSSEMNLTTFDYAVISFSNMSFGELSQVRPVTWIAILVVAFQRILSFLMIGIFLTLLFNVRSQKYERELNQTVEVLKLSAKEQEERIKSYYGYATLEEAAEDLVLLKAAFANFAIRLGSSFARTK
jgi:hypothetical protein